jgi:type I restriction enzyme, S subunit
MIDSLLDIFNDVSIISTPRRDLLKGAFRLDATFYSARSRNIAEVLAASGLPVDALNSIAEVFCSNVRERTFARPSHAYPMLTGSDLDTTTDEALKYVSKVFTRNYDSEKLRSGDVLLSSAGTVGKCDFVWKNHEGKLASQDIVRVRPHLDRISPGYLYSLLRSPVGQSLLSNHSAGSVIIRLYAEQLGTVEIPRLRKAAEESISAKIYASFQARTYARKLVEEAIHRSVEVNNLPELQAEESEEPDCFRLTDPQGISSDNEFRLDGHFHNPFAREAIRKILDCPSPKKTVREVTHDVVMGSRFKRNYVDAAYGTPFLSGRSIVQIRPSDIKYLSNSQTKNLNEMIVKRGWILVSCSGTVGRTCFVWQNFEDYAASQHILRVIPDEEEVDPGYLYAFMSSEYGYEQIIRFRHGSVIDEITDEQLKKVILPLPSPAQQREIGDKVRLAYEKRAEALLLEEEAQAILMNEIKGNPAEES